MAQASSETEIRNVENLQTKAILKGDTSAMYDLWSSAIVVNNPYNIIMTMDQIKKVFRTGKVENTSTLDVDIEKITIVENIAIVMGKEALTPQGTADHSGKKVTRRFTNIWMKNNGAWKLTARQATIISVN